MKIVKLVVMLIAAAVLLNGSSYTDVTYANTADNKSGAIVGAPSQKTWIFESDKSGVYKIVFTYSRPWEKDNSDSKSAEYTVKVTDENNTDSSVVALAANKENTVKKGQKFSVTLEENASTGYSWSYDMKDNGIGFINTEEVPLKGAPVKKVWTFEAKKRNDIKSCLSIQSLGNKIKQSQRLIYIR